MRRNSKEFEYNFVMATYKLEISEDTWQRLDRCRLRADESDAEIVERIVNAAAIDGRMRIHGSDTESDRPKVSDDDIPVTSAPVAESH